MSINSIKTFCYIKSLGIRMSRLCCERYTLRTGYDGDRFGDGETLTENIKEYMPDCPSIFLKPLPSKRFTRHNWGFRIKRSTWPCCPRSSRVNQITGVALPNSHSGPLWMGDFTKHRFTDLNLVK